MSRIQRNNRHHRKSRANGGNSDPRNISIVNVSDHEAFHRLFQNTHPDKIAEVLNETWIDPDYHLIAVNREALRSIKKAINSIT